MKPNLENLQKLKDWLDAGAPHVYFDMQVDLSTTDDAEIFDRTPFETFDDYLKASHPEPKPDCGTVCCIGGAAWLMANNWPDRHPSEWDNIRDQALAWLGLPRTRLGYDWIGHNLFDHNLAPENCTPAQAAQAVQNVMEGKEPWD